MPASKNKKDLKMLPSMNNYVGHFIPNLSPVTLPLRTLLKNQAVWIRDEVCNQAFLELTNLLTIDHMHLHLLNKTIQTLNVSNIIGL